MTFAQLQAAELRAARAQHPPLKSAHEGYAVFLEELDEVWALVKAKRQDLPAMKRELVQVLRFGLRMQARYEEAEIRLNLWADAAGVPRESVMAEVKRRADTTVRDWFDHADDIVIELRSGKFNP